MAFEVRHLWEWKILSSAKGCDGWLKPKSEWCSFFWSKATNLPTFENQFLIGENYETDRLISDHQTLWRHISIYQHIWPHVHILLRLHHLPIRFYHVEEKQCWRVFCAQLFTSVVKNQFQVCSQSNISPHFFIWGTFCGNLLLSIVPQLSAWKTESSKIS